MEELIMLARMGERWIAVAAGVLSIWFGYRLFLKLPVHRNASGELELPGMKVVLTKAGPGLFFAAFGAAIVAHSYIKPIEIAFDEDRGGGKFVGVQSTTPAAEPQRQSVAMIAGAGGPLGSNPVTARARGEEMIAAINCLSKASDNERRRQLAEDANRVLIAAIWDPNWGTLDAFDRWRIADATGVSDRAKAIFRRLPPGC